MAALLNLSESDFEITTPGYLADLLEAYEFKLEREQKFAEIQNREAWERARMLAWYNVQIQLDKKDRTSIKKFMPFPWDAPDAVDVDKMRALVQSAKWVNANLNGEDTREMTKEEVEESYKQLLNEWQH